MIYESCYAKLLVRKPNLLLPFMMGGHSRLSVESGERAGYDGHKRKRGSKVHMAVDTLGNLLALLVTPANEQERAQVAELSQMVQVRVIGSADFLEATGQSVNLAYVDQGYTGEAAAQAAKAQGIVDAGVVDLSVVKLEEAKKGFVLLPRRWVHKCVNVVVERSFAWAARFRRLVKDYERLPQTGVGFAVLWGSPINDGQSRSEGLADITSANHKFITRSRAK